MNVLNLSNACGDKAESIETAMCAIRRDDQNALKKVLINPEANSGDQSKLIDEDTFVNALAEHNLLHYAAINGAAKCVRLLTVPPYLWSPDRPDDNGWSAEKIALLCGYLHVWFPLVANSSSPGHAYVQRDMSSIAYLLVYPHVFLEKPFSVHDSLFSLILDYRPGIDEKLCAASMGLFFELLLSTPEIVEQPLSGFLKLWPWSCSHQDHVAKCTDYPNCWIMSRGIGSQGATWLGLFSNWAAHRMMNTKDLRCFPMRLQEQCRITIRRLVALNLRDQAKKKRDVKVSRLGVFNYANSLNGLPLPKPIKDFLAYQELWPPSPRRMIALPY